MYKRIRIGDDWIITEDGHDWKHPVHWITGAFDTENLVLLDGVPRDPDDLTVLLDDEDMEHRRSRLRSHVWAWQLYDEENGFFMSSSFNIMLEYACRVGYKFLWCYNGKFDFSQIDYEILAKGAGKWSQHIKHKKGQPWTYNSLHNDMGARYSYKLWVPYKSPKDRHQYVHALDFRDFMNIFPGGLAKLLEELDVCDHNDQPIRKLTMEYQQVNIQDPSDQDVDYCRNDVKGLYFALRMYNEDIEEQSDGESHIFGDETNLMTAGGFAKREILRSLYPEVDMRRRIKEYQREHPITEAQDKYYRDNYLYRGGICYLNSKFKSRMVTSDEMGLPMMRYDVNSEYPYAMWAIRDLVGQPKRIKYSDWIAAPARIRDKYEAVMILKSVTGDVKEGYCGLWYDPDSRRFVEHVEERFEHLIFEREWNEMNLWYDIYDYDCEHVIIFKRGDYVFRQFVEENYALKAEAGRQKKAGVKAAVKVKLNSGYGKLAERLVRQKGHFELNEKNGCIHFVLDEEETDMSACMNVAVGSLVTSVARCWILSHIREMFGSDMTERFVYVDTDSIHGFGVMYSDPETLGEFKQEAVCDAIKYLAPKTYMDIETVNDDGTVPLKGIDIHTKGINLAAVRADLMTGTVTLPSLDARFCDGAAFVCLCAMNVKGGKVLIPVHKALTMVKGRKQDDGTVLMGGPSGGYYGEV